MYWQSAKLQVALQRITIHCDTILPYSKAKFLMAVGRVFDEFIGGQYRGTFVVPVPSVLLWYRYRQKIAKYRGTVLVLLIFFYFLVRILRTYH